jgi:MFS transporter, Spinster family, sphingosine-1-phosphate transporter
MLRRPWTIVVLLSGLNLLNYLDRYVVAAVGPTMQRELGLTDLQYGLVVPAFMIGYFVTSPLFGVLGDRYRRKGLITVGVAGWSLATAVSGLMRSFGTMLGARFAVGVGEASYATLAPTIIDDLSEPAHKNRFLSIFYVAIPIGSALGFVIGGRLEHAFGWRTAFFIAGGPGVVLALLTLLIAEPERPRTMVEHPGVRQALRTWVLLFRIPLYRDAVVGYAAYTFALGGFAAWAPKYLSHHLGLDLQTSDDWFGIILVVTGLLATFVGGFLADRFPGADRAKANLRLCAISAALSVPCAVMCLSVGSPAAFFAWIAAAEFALFLSTSPINVVILQGVPEHLRASAMAVSIFAIHLLGDMLSPPIIGAISDRSSLRLGMLVLPVALVLATVAWWRGSAPGGVPAQSPK